MLPDYKQWQIKEKNKDWKEISKEDLEDRIRNKVFGTDTRVSWNGLWNHHIVLNDFLTKDYHYLVAGEMVSTSSDQKIFNESTTGSIQENSKIWGKSFPSGGTPYVESHIVRYTFKPALNDFYLTRLNESITILSGANNQGKSFILKLFRNISNPESAYLGMQRFVNIGFLGQAPTDAISKKLRDSFLAFRKNLARTKQNNDASDYPFEEMLKRMSNEQRNRIFEFCKNLLGIDFSIGKTDETNELSPRYIVIDGENLSFASSGTRLFLGIVTALLDTNLEIVFIDEPELGLSPTLQALVAKYIFDPTLRNEHFGHLSHIFLSTHSQIFLDSINIGNNFIVKKNLKQISIHSINTLGEFHDLRFQMQGNSLETLLLPSVILIVEGPSDYTFVKRIISVVFPDNRISVVDGQGTQMKRTLNLLKDSLGGFESSPYKSRILVLQDFVNPVPKEDLIRIGLPEENLITLSKNGIEYYYPEEIMSRIFSCGKAEIAEMEFYNGSVEINGISKKKTDLAHEVSYRLTDKRQLTEQELQEKIVRNIAKSL